YLEVGAKRTFACALDWPGWARSGRDEEAALAALLESAPRYARVVGRTRLGFVAPGAVPLSDAKAVSVAEVARIARLIDAAWRALDDAVAHARGVTLTKGP